MDTRDSVFEVEVAHWVILLGWTHGHTNAHTHMQGHTRVHLSHTLEAAGPRSRYHRLSCS